MAPTSNALHHGRSLSLPSASHPSILHFDEDLSRLRSSEATYSSLSSTNTRINGLRNLYEAIYDLLLLQQMISEECVDGFISLMDACTSVKDIISLVKEDLRRLLSALRRKDVGGINGYLASRRNSKKMIQRSLKNLRRTSAVSERESEETRVVSMLREAESVAFSLLGSVLSYVLGKKMQEKKGSWSLVSKLMQSKKLIDEENEFNKLDSLLQQSQVTELVNCLKEMESSIQVLEKNLESVFRQLIKTRVSLLNILNH